MLVSGISPSLIPYPHEFLYLCNLAKIFPGFVNSTLVDFNVFTSYFEISLLGLQIDPITGSLLLAASVAHHYYLAISFMVAVFLLRNLKLSLLLCTLLIDVINIGSHLTLAFMLIILSANLIELILT